MLFICGKLQKLLRAMDGDEDDVSTAVNSLLKAGEASPQKAADVLAKVASKDPAKFAKVKFTAIHIL